jgi:hypothetical protein
MPTSLHGLSQGQSAELHHCTAVDLLTEVDEHRRSRQRDHP